MKNKIARIVIAALTLTGASIGVATPASAAPTGSYEAIARWAAKEGKQIQVFDFEAVTASGAAGDDVSVAVTCYGGAIWQYTSVTPTNLPIRTTTTRCLDINMRKSTLVTWWAAACVIFVDHTPDCNYWTDLSSSWRTVATDVLDNTRFRVVLVFDWPSAVGTTTVQLAF